MNGLGTARRLRATALWAATTLGVTLLLRWCEPDLADAPAARDFADLLVSGCAAALALCGCWWWLVTTAVVLQVWRGSVRERTPGVPVAVRRVLLAACGVALAGAGTLPAVATPGAVLHGADRPTRSALTGLPLPDRPLGGLRPTPVPPAAPAATVVAPGDSLWSIAAHRLGPAATDADTAAYCRRLHALNRSTIGPDPDLIRPGQRLVLPDHPTS
ncbi:LysM peptidoglycan-binding domain-containing protein [Nocardioides sp. cx-173]|uniref:LysM peptidoglycan-binding domain-containing protein n=1 Tax=Nocardioides sp. cx-173 TaxID=2898796 RepID=UPI001E362D0A|nr:LysM domain-containing protein [Nocardioides sp. cx-173]MCD4525360.1 LysM peptidoglycan-binding domain-containing protein [Nocardioides sp. cx-173]UGB40844.1 LysM peptidoglycan-binding domain-containing protein [Nocardioides sp. cx-173]